MSLRTLVSHLKEMHGMLDIAVAHAEGVVDFLRPFRVEDIEAAIGVPQLTIAVAHIFSVAQRAIRNSEFYKIERVLDFLAALERAVSERAVFLLGGGSRVTASDSSASRCTDATAHRLLMVPFADFIRILEEFRGLHVTWQDSFNGGSIGSAGSGDNSRFGNLGTDNVAGLAGTTSSNKGEAELRGAGHIPVQQSGLRDFLINLAKARPRRVSEHIASASKAAEVAIQGCRRIDQRSNLDLIAARLEQLEAFRREHEELFRTIQETLGNASTVVSGSRLGDAASLFSMGSRTHPVPAKISATSSSDNDKSGGSVQEFKIIREVRSAYEQFCLNASSALLENLDDGEALGRFCERYQERVARVEEGVVRILTERLDEARGAEELFAVLRCFREMFVRPRVRAAVVGHQARILNEVTGAVAELRAKQIAGYGGSASEQMAIMKDLPPVAGHILWANKIKRQLEHLEEQLAVVLTPDWARIVGDEGVQLAKEIEHLQSCLDPNMKYDVWIRSCHQHIKQQVLVAGDFVLSLREESTERMRGGGSTAVRDNGRCIAILKSTGKQCSRNSKRGFSRFCAQHTTWNARGSECVIMAASLAAKLHLDVNFDERMLTILKEARNLRWLFSARIPKEIDSIAARAELRYPVVVALRGALGTYAAARRRMLPGLSLLLEKQLKAVRLSIEQAFPKSRQSNDLRFSDACSSLKAGEVWIHWKMQEHAWRTFDEWASQLRDNCFAFERAVDDLLSNVAIIDQHLRALARDAPPSLLKRAREREWHSQTAAQQDKMTHHSGSSDHHSGGINDRAVMQREAYGSGQSEGSLADESEGVDGEGRDEDDDSLWCPFDELSISGRVGAIQAVIDDLNRHDSFSNMASWVYALNRRVDDILVQRVTTAVEQWTDALESKDSRFFDGKNANIEYAPSSRGGDGSRNCAQVKEKLLREKLLVGSASSLPRNASMSSVSLSTQSTQFLLNPWILERTTFTIRNASHQLYLSPSTAEVRRDLMAFVEHHIVGAAARVRPLSLKELSLKSQGRSRRANRRAATNGTAMTRCLVGAALQRAWKAIDRRLLEVDNYVRTTWLQYQALWELRVSDIVSKFQWEAHFVALQEFLRDGQHPAKQSKLRCSDKWSSNEERVTQHVRDLGRRAGVPLRHVTTDGVQLGAWVRLQQRALCGVKQQPQSQHDVSEGGVAEAPGMLSVEETGRLRKEFPGLFDEPADALSNSARYGSEVSVGINKASSAKLPNANSVAVNGFGALNKGFAANERAIGEGLADQAVDAALHQFTSVSATKGRSGSSGRSNMSETDDIRHRVTNDTHRNSMISSDGMGGIGIAGIHLWLQLLKDIKTARSSFDTTSTIAQFGSLVVDYSLVQTRVMERYDDWAVQLARTFGIGVLEAAIRWCHANLVAAKNALEDTNLARLEELPKQKSENDASCSFDLVKIVGLIQSMRHRWEKIGDLVKVLIASERELKSMLRRGGGIEGSTGVSSCIFHSQWMEASILHGLYGQLSDILHRNGTLMDSQMDIVKQRVMEDDEALGARVSELTERWWKVRAGGPEFGVVATADGSMLYKGRRLWDDFLEGLCRRAVDRERNGPIEGGFSTARSQVRSTPTALSPTAVRELLNDEPLRKRIQVELLELPAHDLRHTVGASHDAVYDLDASGKHLHLDADDAQDEATAQDRDSSFQRYIFGELAVNKPIPREKVKAILLRRECVAEPNEVLKYLSSFKKELVEASVEVALMRSTKAKLGINEPTPLGTWPLAVDGDEGGHIGSAVGSGLFGGKNLSIALESVSKDLVVYMDAWNQATPLIQRLKELHALRWNGNEESTGLAVLPNPKTVRRQLGAIEKEATNHRSHRVFLSIRAHAAQRQQAMLTIQDLMNSDAIKAHHLRRVLSCAGRCRERADHQGSGFEGGYGSSLLVPLKGLPQRQSARDSQDARYSGLSSAPHRNVPAVSSGEKTISYMPEVDFDPMLLTLGDFNAIRLMQRDAKKFISGVVVAATGELALELFFKELEESWRKYTLEMVHYQNSGVLLLRGWEQLFGKFENDLMGLSAMKQSPYYLERRLFQSECESWEYRLGLAQQVFQVWMEVQRRWVYLGGIFQLDGAGRDMPLSPRDKGSDIKQQLPNEVKLFKAINSEFVELLKKARNNPLALEICTLRHTATSSGSSSGDDSDQCTKLLRQLERNANSMQRIQRSLGEYLERQRLGFSRFYFVGDDDLLEIVGNARDPRKILPHLAKMFAGISGLEFVADETVPANVVSNVGMDVPTGLVMRKDQSQTFLLIKSMVSKENEVVPLTDSTATEIPLIIAHGNAKAWLTSLEKNMQITLAGRLNQCFKSLNALPPIKISFAATSGTGSEDGSHSYGTSFDSWLKLLPVQVACLAVQMKWTLSIEQALRGGTREEMDALYGSETRAAEIMIETMGSIEAHLVAKLKIVARNILAPAIAAVGAPGGGPTECPRMGHNARRRDGLGSDGLTMPRSLRRKYELLIGGLVHQRDVTRLLRLARVLSTEEFDWISHLRVYPSVSYSSMTATALPTEGATSLGHCECRIANVTFSYGYEYTGASDRLVQTPLTDRCYLTLTQALHLRLGGNPFGPAGTGKTETVKALGAALGRFVLVFNCDESFDFAAMGRLFRGLCQVSLFRATMHISHTENVTFESATKNPLTSFHALCMISGGSMGLF